MMHRSDATSVGDVGPLAAPGRTKRIAPYAIAAVVLYEMSTRVTADDLARGAIALGVGCAVVPSIRRLVAEIHDQARALSHLADHDALTGLPNRRALDRRIDASNDDSAIRGEPFQLGAAIVSVSASVGVSHSSEGGRHAQQLLRDADQAMYAHKRGRHRCATIHDAGGHLVVDWPPGDDDAAGPCEA